MKSAEYFNHPNSKIRSFLSSYNKQSNRSYSASQFHHYEKRKNIQADKMGANPQKVHIERERGRNKLQINMGEYAKCDKKESRLIKYRMKEKQNFRDQKMDDNSDLITKIRQLKQKVLRLQIEKKMLEENQQQDTRTILKQNEIIKNLQEAISLNRVHFNYSEKRNWQKQRDFMSEKQMRKSQNYDNTRMKDLQNEIQKLKSERTRILEQNTVLQQQNKRLLNWQQKQRHRKPEEEASLENQCILQQERRLRQIESKLTEASDMRKRQFQEIDTLLFSQNF